MLSPRQLDGLSDDIVETYSQLETDILRDMARRIARLGRVTDATEWQARMLAEAGGLKRNIARILARYDKEIVRQVTEAFEAALEAGARSDSRVFKAATGRTVSAPNAQATLAAIRKCRSDLSRLTLTTAATSQRQFAREANRAYMKVQSGAFSYDDATRDAADALAERGITAVQYEGGRPVTRTIESAVRMNILTGINQTAASQTLSNCGELDCDLVEVSAHVGSRPEHEAWQGKVYSVSGKSARYPPFSVCGLGTAGGICGVNCRHSFYPYFEGMERHYTQDDLDEMAGERVSYTDGDGKRREMTRYEAEQRLRHVERGVRRWKRRALTEEAAGVDSTLARRKMGEWQAAARDFAKQTGIARDYAREYVGGQRASPVRSAPTLAAETARTRKAAERAFPSETWREQSKSVFAAETRLAQGMKSKREGQKLEREISQAKILAKNGHPFYLTPETGAGKHYDGFAEGEKTDLKLVTGNIRTLGKRYKDSLEQANGVFIQTSGKTAKEIFSKLASETRELLKSGRKLKDNAPVFIWIDGENKLRRWKMADIIAAAKRL